MSDTHFIIGKQRQCLCGLYGERRVTCHDISGAIRRIEAAEKFGHMPYYRDLTLLCEVLKSLRLNPGGCSSQGLPCGVGL